MVKILFVVPYPQLSEFIDQKIDFGKLKERFRDDFELHLLIPVPKRELEKQKLHGASFLKRNNYHYVAFSEKEFDEIVINEINRLKISFDIIIARGNTTERLRKRQGTPITSLQMTAYDIIQALTECIEKYSPKKIGILASNNLVYNTETIGKLLGIEIESYNIPSLEKKGSTIDRAVEHGCEAVIGGYSVYTDAQSKGIPATFIQTGENSILLAIEEAIRTFHILQKEREMSVSYQTVIHASRFGILKVDKNLTINMANNQAIYLLKLGNTKVIDEPLSKVFIPLSSYVQEALDTGRSIYNAAIKTDETAISANFLPIIVKKSAVGVLIYLQSVTDVQTSESELRRKIFSNGFEAKYTFSHIIYQSKMMEKVITIAKQYAQASSNILISGESGTGKELFAQSIHNYSKRSSGPFVPVNCAAISDSLLESELFGYAEGAFTGARKGGKPGLFELAHNGTLFLDEIGEMPLATQSKLLRVLQEKEVRRVGGDTVIPIDVRIIAATNRNLNEMTATHAFREDLLFRLDVLRLVVPPLRARREDIEPLLKCFVEHYSIANGVGIPEIDQEVIDSIKLLPFKGNTRELQNLAERLCVTQSGDRISFSNLEMTVTPGLITPSEERSMESNDKGSESLQANLGKSERDLIIKALHDSGGNKISAAQALGIDRSSLYRKIKKYGI